jgi:thiamine biosynthesis lipoprotein
VALLTPVAADTAGAVAVEGFAFAAMASRCEIRLAAPDRATAALWADAAIAEVRRIEAKFSRYRDDSMVSKINAAAGADAAVECDAETVALLDYAEALFVASDGRFDITSGILRRAWNFQSKCLPEATELVRLCGLVGWQSVERRAGTIRLPQPGMEIDFGGFGKEYAADRAAAVLRELGARNGFVNLGGDLHAIGPQPDGSAWRIAIQDPRDASRAAAEIELSQGGLATSGDYERFFEIDGVRYCHILNPTTGWPVAHWRSVSVAAPLCIAAGSCSTIAMLAQDHGLAFLAGSGLAYLAIDADGVHFNGEKVDL